jgi:hypothetical protein
MLAVRRRLDIHPQDRAVRLVHEACESRPGAGENARRSPCGSCDETISLGEQDADGLVRLDPGRRDACVLEHPMRYRAIAGGRVVIQRQATALVRQVVEGAFLHRGPDLPLDHRLADALTRWLGGVGSLRVSSVHDPPERTPAADRRAVAGGR